MVYIGGSPRFSEPTARSPAVLLGGLVVGVVVKVGRACLRGTSGVCTAGGQEVPRKPVFRMALKNEMNIK